VLGPVESAIALRDPQLVQFLPSLNQPREGQGVEQLIINDETRARGRDPVERGDVRDARIGLRAPEVSIDAEEPQRAGVLALPRQRADERPIPASDIDDLRLGLTGAAQKLVDQLAQRERKHGTKKWRRDEIALSSGRRFRPGVVAEFGMVQSELDEVAERQVTVCQRVVQNIQQ
jgi:hypothetical protein